VLLAQGQVLAVPAASAAAAPTRYDVVVYGGTPGGIMAAVAAARDGASVLIIEQKRHVGGLTTSGLCNDEVHHMHPWSVGGLSREFYERLGRAYGRPPIAEVWQERKYNTWESKVAQRVFDEMLAEAKVPVRYGLRVTEVAKDGPRIRHIVLTDGSRVSGKVFLDCTYEGDLMARSGVRYTFGRESSGQYGESLAGIRLGDKRVKAKTRDVDGRLLPGISATIDQLEPGGADRMVQNYNFRLTLTQDENNRVPFPRPRDYDPRRYALLANYLAEHPDTKLKGIFASGSIGNGKFEANNHQNAIISLGHFGGHRDYPDADYETQDRIYQDHVDYTQGLFWFLLHDPAVPEPLRRETATWGLAKDEFTDNGNWPYYPYIREARRMIGRFVMTQKDVQTDRSKDDSVLLGSHYIDCHHLQRVAVNDDEFTNDGRIWVPGKVYEIPYRSLTPEAEQCDNLLVPVAASFSHVAFCPYRLEPTWMAAGHSTGLAAAMAARSGLGVQQIDVAELQKRLESQGQPLKLRDDR
jgi:hypothetical protein